MSAAHTKTVTFTDIHEATISVPGNALVTYLAIRTKQVAVLTGILELISDGGAINLVESEISALTGIASELAQAAKNAATGIGSVNLAQKGGA
jgi:hypothetical protein